MYRATRRRRLSVRSVTPGSRIRRWKPGAPAESMRPPTSRTRDTLPRPERLCETWPRSDDCERVTSLPGGALETGKRRFARNFAFRNPRPRSVLARDAPGTSKTLYTPGRAANLPRASPAATSSLPGMRMALCGFQRRFLRRRARAWRKKAPSQWIERGYRIQRGAIGSSATPSDPSRRHRIQSEVIGSSARPSDPAAGRAVSVVRSRVASPVQRSRDTEDMLAAGVCPRLDDARGEALSSAQG
jgi:hypothetical protein